MKDQGVRSLEFSLRHCNGKAWGIPASYPAFFWPEFFPMNLFSSSTMKIPLIKKATGATIVV